MGVEVTELDDVNLSPGRREEYFKWKTACKEAIKSRPHVISESSEYRWSSCGAGEEGWGWCMCVSGGLMVSGGVDSRATP